MNKAELINAIADETGLSKKDTEATINSFVNVVSNALENKDKVQLIGFGTFETRERAARTGRNPCRLPDFIRPFKSEGIPGEFGSTS